MRTFTWRFTPLQLLLLFWTSNAAGAAVRVDPEFSTSDLGPNDDASSPAIPLGFTVRFANEDVSDVYVSNNGYLSVGQPGGEQFTSTIFTQKLLAPFFADVDTRDASSGTVHWGTGTVDGHRAFAVTWPGVGYFHVHGDRLNRFQVVIIDRADVKRGAMDVEMNYDTIQWECGDAECGGGGQGNNAALVGFSNGITDSLQPGSNTPGALLDTSTETGLVHGSLGSNVPGRYLYSFRESNPDGGADLPDPGNSDPSRKPFGCTASNARVKDASSKPAVGLVMLTLWAIFSRRGRRLV